MTKLERIALLAGALLYVAGCATERYLTEEQDARMRAFCEPHGCEVIPKPAWERIEQLLRLLGLTSS